MNRVITIGREFGSGGREFGKRLAETMNIAYYDEEILTVIVEKGSFSKEYVNSILENQSIHYYPITVARTFSLHYAVWPNETLFKVQRETLFDLAKQGNCVIVGRCADQILHEQNPIRIFLYADIDSRITRCRLKAPEGEDLTDAQMKKRILTIVPPVQPSSFTVRPLPTGKEPSSHRKLLY